LWGPQLPAAAPPEFLLARAQAPRSPVPKLRRTHWLFAAAPFHVALWGPSLSGVNWESLAPSPDIELDLQVAAFSFLALLRLLSHPPGPPPRSHLVLAPPPDPQIRTHRSRSPHAPDLHQAGASAARRKTPGPRSGCPVGTVCLENRNPGRGAGRGAPSPPQSASCPSRLPPSDTQAGRRARGRPGWGRGGGFWMSSPSSSFRSPTLGSPGGAAPRPRSWPPGRRGRGGVKLPQGPPRAGRGGAPLEEAQPAVRSPAQGREGRGGEGAAAARGAGRWGAGPRRGERAGAAAAARPAGGSARRWCRLGRVRAPCCGPKSE
jgi:hypothetical protein